MESAVTLTKAIRWDIQKLGTRLSKAAAAEEFSRRNKSGARSKVAHELEIRLIVKDVKELLVRIEDAVPLINLAITTSGASLTTALPPTVSPSRLLQASMFLTEGDGRYYRDVTLPAQVGPTFTLSLYMLFSGHIHRAHDDDDDGIRDTTWKEVIHKAKVKLFRVPLKTIYGQDYVRAKEVPLISGEGRADEFTYHLEIVEDLDDGRVHTFEDGEPQPGSYGDVQLAGIRETLPIYQICKIFYANTGKILNIGNQDETNSPVLLLKRDVNAPPPRRRMESKEMDEEWQDSAEDLPTQSHESTEDEEDPQLDIDQQLRRESMQVPTNLNNNTPRSEEESDLRWKFPPNLDSEWMAFEVWSEAEDSVTESEAEDEQSQNNDSAYASHRPSSSGEPGITDLSAGLAKLEIDQTPSPSPTSPNQHTSEPSLFPVSVSTNPSPFGLIRTSLSLLEMLIRLTSLQQFTQTSHLAISDELLTFFLTESATTGAGADGEQRRRTRREAVHKVGFDPYDESPIKIRGEEYQAQGQENYREYSREGTPYDGFDQRGPNDPASPQWIRERSTTPQRNTPEPWLLRGMEGPSSRRSTPEVPSSSPISPYRPQRKIARPLELVHQERRGPKGSPLGRGMSAETDSSLGTSPGTPTLIGKVEKDDDIS